MGLANSKGWCSLSLSLIITILMISSTLSAHAVTHLGELQAYTFARKAYQDQLYEVVVRATQDYLKNFPQGSHKDQILYLLASALFYQERLQEAKTYLQQLKGRHPPGPLYPATLYRLAQIYLREQRYQLAIKELEQLPQGDKGREREPYLYLLALCYLGLKEYAQASQGFKLLLDLFPQSPRRGEYRLRYGEALFSWGLTLFQKERYQKACKVLQIFIQQDPKGELMAKALYLKGVGQEKLGHYDRAIESYSLLLEKYPQDDWSLAALGRRAYLYFQQKDYNRSILDYKDLIQRTDKPYWVNTALYMLGENFWAQRDYDSAIAYFSRLISHKGDQKYLIQAYIKRAFSYFYQKRYQEVLQDLSSLENLKPSNELREKILYLRGQTYLQLRKYKQAIANYEALLREFPLNQSQREVLFNLGFAKKQLNDHRGAIAAWEKIVQPGKRTKESCQTYLQLGITYREVSKLEEAIARLEEATKCPDNLVASEAHYWLAETFLDRGDIVQGKAQLETLLKKAGASETNPWVAMAYSRIGALYEQMGQANKAREAYLMVTKLSEDKELLEFSRRRLQILGNKGPRGNPSGSPESSSKREVEE